MVVASPKRPPFSLIDLRTNSYSITIALVGVFLLALALRLYCLDCHSLWYDEITSVQTAQRGIEAIFTYRFGWIGNQTPLHYLLVWLTIQPLDPNASSLLVRLPSALAGAFTVLVAYGIGRELFGRVTGVLAGLLVALCAVHLNYSQDLRPYSILVFLSALSVYCLLVAERTASARWWAAFVVATLLNVFQSYNALVLFIPTLVPYLLWVLWKLWPKPNGKQRGWGPFAYALLSMAVVAVSSVPVLLDVLRIPRSTSSMSVPSFGTIAAFVIELMTWFTRFGIGGPVEQLAQLGLLLLAILGTYAGLRRGRQRGVFLCGLLVAIPPIMLAVLSSSSAVFQRYALFSMPFYFLLIANGLSNLLLGTYPTGARAYGIIIKGLAAGALGLILVVFTIGVLNYNSPERGQDLSFRPDYHGVTGYLSGKVRNSDVIIFVDDPALSATATNFYWRGAPPTAVFDARDPLLFAHKAQGDIYWVVSEFRDDPTFLGKLSAPAQGWVEARRFEGLVVLREARPPASILESMDHMVAKFEAIHPDDQPVRTLRGCIFQARAQVAEAVSTYRSAGTYFPLGDEFLRTAQGLDAHGDPDEAWREALLSKFNQPDRAEVHVWLAQKLQANGHDAESLIEAQIADNLR